MKVGVNGVVKKVRIVGARRYIQGYPPFQHKVLSYPIEFVGEDALMPLEKYESDEKFKKIFEKFSTLIVEE
jgi:hypothetical protein